MRTTGEGISVLHVDDEPEFASMVAEFVEREDDRLSVDPVPSATEGLERLGTGSVNCIVSDYEMPGRDGIEFLEAVRAEHPDLPFILYTGKGSEEVASEAISAGVTDYLQKTGGTEQYALLANRIVASVERYRARQAVDWQRAIIQNMGEGVYVFDRDHVLRYVNFRVPDVDSISEDDWEGRHVSYLAEIDVLSADETAGIERGVDRILGGETDECRLSVEPRLPGGVEKLDLRFVPVDTGVEGEFVLVTSRDVTERDGGAGGS
jgi:CheY-like chemotaxis protein